MTEDEYVFVLDLARMRSALDILRPVMHNRFRAHHIIADLYRQINLAYAEFRLEHTA